MTDESPAPEETSIYAINDEIEDEDSEPEQPNISKVAHYIHTNDPFGLKRFLASFKSKDEIKELVNQRDNTGKSPLDIAACLGRVEVTNQLILHGAKLDSYTSKGYTCMHHAAAWGHLNVLKVHVENGGRFNKLNIHGETPVDIASRYKQFDCAEYLLVTAEKRKMQAEVLNYSNRIKDIDKISAGKITKDEKNLVITLCTEKQEWLENATDVSLADIQAQLTTFIDVVHPIFHKLSEHRLAQWIFLGWSHIAADKYEQLSFIAVNISEMWVHQQISITTGTYKMSQSIPE